MPHKALRTRPRRRRPRPRIRPRGVIWRRICGQVLRVFVPEGRNDRSQAIYCLECATQRTRPVGNGVIGSPGRFSTMGGEYVV